MIYDLICLSLFFTLNVTDLQWRDLYAYMLDREIYMTASENEWIKIAWRLLQKNSHIIIECLNCRVTLFLKLVIKKKFKIQNFWYCFKWQSCESEYIHEFLWINNASSVTDLDWYLSFWEIQITIFNFINDLSVTAVYSSSRFFSERTNMLHELIELLNHFQHYTRCTSSYCQRKIKETDELTCCFHFSQSERSLSEVSCKMNSHHHVYLLVQNDILLNSYNVMMIMKWMINMNFSSCMNQTTVMHYLIKYCFKIEKKSESFKSLLQFIMLKVSERALLLSLATKLINKLIVERDWSAQEMYHHILQQDLQNFSQVVQNLDLWSIKKQRCALNLQNDNVTVFKIFLKHYCERSAYQKHLTLLIATWEYTWINKTWNFRSWCDHLKMINLFSHYLSQSSHVNFSNFCKVKLMLHHCFWSVILDDLLNDDDENWVSAYVTCAINHDHSRDSLRVVLKMIKMNSEIEFLKHDEIKQNQNLRHEELLSWRRSNHDNSLIQIFINLSERFMNKNHNWLQFTCDTTLIIIQDHSIVAHIIRKNAFASTILEKIDSFSLLNVEQRDVVDWIIDHYCYHFDA